jgi:DNA (cytosine-5)-methyltransferase 1
MEAIRIIKEMREATNGANPVFGVWENVPGAFSSNKGEDFRIVLEETAMVCDPTAVIPRPEGGKWTNAGAIVGDGWSIAWRVHDAQFWGVPQRRRRIALVADFGGATAPEILFERESVSGNITQGSTSWQDFAAAIAKRFGTTNRAELETEHLTYCIQGNSIDRADTAGCNGIGWREDKSYTLNTADRPAVFDARGNGDGNTSPTMTGDHNNRITDYTAVVVGGLTVAGFKSGVGAGSDIAYREEQAPTLLAGSTDASVIVPTGYSQAAYDKFNADDKTATLKAQGGSYGGGQ